MLESQWREWKEKELTNDTPITKQLCGVFCIYKEPNSYINSNLSKSDNMIKNYGEMQDQIFLGERVCLMYLAILSASVRQWS